MRRNYAVAVKAVRPLTLNGTTYAAGDTVAGADLAATKRLSALFSRGWLVMVSNPHGSVRQAALTARGVTSPVGFSTAERAALGGVGGG